MEACNFIKKRLQHRCFPAKFLRTPFFIEHVRWLLLQNFNERLNEAFIIYFKALKSSLKVLNPASHEVLYPFNVKRSKMVRPGTNRRKFHSVKRYWAP